ncbi:PglY protein [Actinomadura sp. GTD37]|uniref:PglY protein n=1 Tax=Actinomadura sp. GTD37 TaxID=1778030 RepID=UPI0035C08EE5
MSSPVELRLKDVLDIPESVHAGQFKVELSGGFDATFDMVGKYVVTDQLAEAFRKSLRLVRDALQEGESAAAYLHGSFGSGKSHFMTVLHAVLDGHSSVLSEEKPRLREVYADNASWLGGKKFMMVPYHLVGATDLDSKILGGYVREAERLGLPTPAVFRSDALLADARRQRKFFNDDTKFAEWLGGAAAVESDPEDVAPLGGSVSGWSTASLDAAFSAAPGSPEREALVSALLSGPLSAYAAGQRGAADAYLPLENGLAVMSRHAQQHGFHGLILFIDELILWLQAHMSDQVKVNNEVSKLVKIIESEDRDRGVPIISFVSRQRDLSKLVGDDIVGAEVKNLERQVAYLAERFDVVSLEDRNLPAIVKERVLRKLPGGQERLDTEFASVESGSQIVRDVLLDHDGLTQATWEDFKTVYPLSPALLNVLVALSGALQRERTGLRLLTEMLRQRREYRVGQIIPLGDLWDVLSTGLGEAMSHQLDAEAAAAVRFHARVRANLLETYGSEDDERYKADDRLVKTLILSALAPDVSALTRLTGARLAALNHGSVRSRTVPAGSVVVQRLRRLITAGFGEIRADGDADPVFTLHLTDLNIEPLLDAVGDQDHSGARRIWVKERLWSGDALGIKDTGAFVCEREVVWRGTRRTVEFVFENVRDDQAIRDDQFAPSLEGRIRIIIDYPFDTSKFPSDDFQRVQELKRDGQERDTLVWLPDHLSAARQKQLGRLLKINFLLQHNRLSDYAGHLSPDERARTESYLAAQQATLTSELTSVLQQVYGINSGDSANIAAEVSEGKHVLSLNPAYPDPRLHGGAGFSYNLMAMTDGLFAVRYPKHPDFDTAGNRKPVTLGELKTALQWITRAFDDGSKRVVVDRDKLPLLRRIVHPLELGQVHDGPLIVTPDWQRRIDQAAAQHGVTGDLPVEEIRRWIEELGWTGMDRPVSNLIIATYALLSDRAWVYEGGVSPAPELDKIGTSWALRAQALPSEQEYRTARLRLAKIFGEKVPEPLFARNVDKLGAALTTEVTRLSKDVMTVMHLLDEHNVELGLAPGSRRQLAARHGADLIVRLSSTTDATTLVKQLAAVSYETPDEELGSAIVSTPDVARALNGVAWPILGSLRELTQRQDDIGDQARRLTGTLAQTANENERIKPLAPVLEQTGSAALALITQVSRTMTATTGTADAATTASQGGQRAANGAAEAADQTSLTFEGTPPVPSDAPPAAGRYRTSRSDQAVRLAAVRDDIRRFLDTHPDTEVEISWRPVERD